MDAIVTDMLRRSEWSESETIQNGDILLKKSVDEIREDNGKSVDELFREVFRW